MRCMSFLKGHSVLDQRLPHLTLASPIGHGSNGTDIFLADRITVLDGTGGQNRISSWASGSGLSRLMISIMRAHVTYPRLPR